MHGMSQMVRIGILLDVDPGECMGEDCVWSGPMDATHDPYEEVAEWTCPGCGNNGRRDIPSEDF